MAGKPSPLLTAPTSPHKRSLKYARIRIVFDGRDKAVRRVATRLAPLAWGLAGHMMSAQL